MKSTIEISVSKKKIEKNGKTFDVFKTKGKNDKWLDVRFTKESGGITESGTIVCDIADVNVNTLGKYPVLWVKKIKKFVPYREQVISDYFEV